MDIVKQPLIKSNQAGERTTHPTPRYSPPPGSHQMIEDCRDGDSDDCDL
jgi:hypothetical protein